MQHRDEDAGKGAVEQDRREQKGNVSQTGQNAHGDQDPLLKDQDSDFPEPGQNEEHTGEPRERNELKGDAEGGRRTTIPVTGRRKIRIRARTIRSLPDVR